MSLQDVTLREVALMEIIQAHEERIEELEGKLEWEVACKKALMESQERLVGQVKELEARIKAVRVANIYTDPDDDSRITPRHRCCGVRELEPHLPYCWLATSLGWERRETYAD